MPDDEGNWIEVSTIDEFGNEHRTNPSVFACAVCGVVSVESDGRWGDICPVCEIIKQSGIKLPEREGGS